MAQKSTRGEGGKRKMREREITRIGKEERVENKHIKVKEA